MKKITTLLLVLVLVLGMCCTALAEEPLRFGYVSMAYSDNWNNGSMQGFEYICKDYGVEVQSIDCGNNGEEQVAAVENFINEGVDGIVIFQITPELSATLIDMCEEAGIPVVIENAVPDARVNAHLGVSCLSYEMTGYECFKAIAEKYPGSKVVFVRGTLGMGVAEEYEKGINRAIEEFADANISYEVAQGDWTAEGGLNALTDYINSGAEFDVVFGNTGQVALGCVQALSNEGLTADKPLVAPGTQLELKTAIENDALVLDVQTSSHHMGMTSFSILYNYVKHGVKLADDEKVVNLNSVVITKDNVADFQVMGDLETGYRSFTLKPEK